MIQRAADLRSNATLIELQWLRKVRIEFTSFKPRAHFFARIELDTSGPRPQTCRPADIELAEFRSLVARFCFYHSLVDVRLAEPHY